VLHGAQRGRQRPRRASAPPADGLNPAAADAKPGTLAGSGAGASGRSFRVNAAGVHVEGSALQRGLTEVASLYKVRLYSGTRAGRPAAARCPAARGT
jgi:hypothetical protein